jgi:hypothetical protein
VSSLGGRALYAQFAMDHAKALKALEGRQRFHEIMAPEFPMELDEAEYRQLLDELEADG